MAGMPICPGCERQFPYDRLHVHERYCGGIWGPEELGRRSAEGLERRLVALEERFDDRLRDLETDIERRLLWLEKKRQDSRPAQPD